MVYNGLEAAKPTVTVATATQNIRWDSLCKYFFPHILTPIITACDLKEIISHFPSGRV